MPTNTTLLAADARNRGIRSFLTGLAIDIAVGVTLVLVAAVSTATGWGDLQWAILGFSLAKSVVQAGGAFVLRRFLDPSRLPTPLPPDEPGEPSDDATPSVPAPRDGGEVNIDLTTVVALVLLTLILLALLGVLPTK